MELEKFYESVGGDYKEVRRRIPSDDAIQRFVTKFPNDQSYEKLRQAVEKKDYEEAYRVQKHILETEGTLEIFRNEARCECLFYELTHGQDKETIEKLYDKKLQKYIKATAIYPSKLRLMFAYYYLYEKDDQKVQEIQAKLERSVDTYMIKVDAVAELATVKKLMQASDASENNNQEEKKR